MAGSVRLLVAALLVASFAGCKNKNAGQAEPGEESEGEPAVEESATEAENIPVSWVPGDSARGREVFVAKACFRCHQVLLDDGLMELHRVHQATLANKATGQAMDHGAMDHGAMDHGAMDHGAMKHGGKDAGAMDHGGHNADDTPTGHHLPPPLNAGTLAKPGLVLFQQTLAPSVSPKQRIAHYERMADAFTVGDLTDVVAFLSKVSRVKPPAELPLSDLEPGWPDGDATAGKTAFGKHCLSCHAVPGLEAQRELLRRVADGVVPPDSGDAEGPALTRGKLSDRALVLVRGIVLGRAGAAGHPAHSRAMTLRQLTDVVAYLVSRP